MASRTTPQMRRLARSKLDKTGDWLRERLPILRSTPCGGWIAATRGALGMSQVDLAKRLGVMPSTVLKLERNERVGTIHLDTLQRAASALDCEVVVLVVPKQPLQTSVDQQRLKLYNERFNRAATHMKLEDQAVSEDLRRHLLQAAESAIPDTELWRENDGEIG